MGWSRIFHWLWICICIGWMADADIKETLIHVHRMLYSVCSFTLQSIIALQNRFTFEFSGCPGAVWFQSSSSNLSTLLTSDATYNHLPPGLLRAAVRHGPTECARMCMEKAQCKSAIYLPDGLVNHAGKKRPQNAHSSNELKNLQQQEDGEENGTKKGGICTLLPTSPDCNEEIGLISEINSDTRPVFMHCFSCTPFLSRQPKKETNKRTMSGEMAKTNAHEWSERMVNETGGRRREKRQQPRGFSLRVMTFNCFVSGDMVERGLEKIAKHILANEPEIVFLQEMNDVHIRDLLSRLDDRVWSSCSRNSGQLNHILTRLDIAQEFDPAGAMWNNGCQIRLWPPDDDFVINLWNVHLYPMNYGPYKACSKNTPLRSTNELFDGESNRFDPSRGRLEQVTILSQHGPFAQLLTQASRFNGPPLIVAGDFNSPSHLDWIESSRPLHCGLAFQWPVSTFMERLGFRDSYRFLRRDPVLHRGATWSTIYKDSTTEFVDGRPEPEPQDRIDFIYYRGRNLQVVDSYVYAGTEAISVFPHIQFNDWPSDHASVVTRFVWTQD